MSAIIVRQFNENETDLLTGHESAPVVVTDLDGVIIAELKAPGNGWAVTGSGWTIEKLEALEPMLNAVYVEWEASLAGEFIGSSEV